MTAYRPHHQQQQATISGELDLNDDNSIPLADADPQAIIVDDASGDNSSGYSRSTGGSPEPNDDADCLDEMEEKARLITQVLELQNTLDDLSQRVDGVKEENFKLRSENQVLGQYIENLMSASSVFQSTGAPAASGGGSGGGAAFGKRK